jgi:hypothetical protein
MRIPLMSSAGLSGSWHGSLSIPVTSRRDSPAQNRTQDLSIDGKSPSALSSRLVELLLGLAIPITNNKLDKALCLTSLGQILSSAFTPAIILTINRPIETP